MKLIEEEFVTNANACGNMTFKRVKQGVNPSGRNVYMYSRTRMNGELFSFEVFTPLIKKAGKYKLPTPKGEEQKWIVYEEDFEQYPGASLFGRIAWEYRTLFSAEEEFKALTAAALDVPETEEDEETEAPASVSEEPKHRGRPKKVLPPIVPPDGEFSAKELAAKNGVEYFDAYQFIQKNPTLFVPTRTERRAPRGPETQLYKKA